MSQLSQNKLSAWTEHINQQRESKLTYKAYCKTHNLNYHQFGYWKRKLEGKINKTAAPSKKQSAFIPVDVAASDASAGLSISLPNGIVLNGITENNHSLTLQIIGALR